MTKEEIHDAAKRYDQERIARMLRNVIFESETTDANWNGDTRKAWINRLAEIECELEKLGFEIKRKDK